MIKHTWAFFLSTSAAVTASIFVLAGSALWTVLINRAGDVNSWIVQPAKVPLGIEVTNGIGLYLSWAAFACLVTSIIPYTIRSVLSDSHDFPSPDPLSGCPAQLLHVPRMKV